MTLAAHHHRHRHHRRRDTGAGAEASAGLILALVVLSLLPGCARREIATTAQPAAAIDQATAARIKPADDPCASDNGILFQCSHAGRAVTLCAIASSTQAVSALGYRLQLDPQQPDQVATGKLDTARVHFSTQGYSGGGEARLRFQVDSTQYLLFERTIRTGFDPDGGNNPEFSTGVIVSGGGHDADWLCDEPAGFRSAAYKELPREPFDDGD